MPILRAEHRDRFTVVTNAVLEDPRLSNAAKGLLVRMLSLADDWTFSVRGLAAVCRDGRDAVQRQLCELERCGYLVRKQKLDAGNRFCETEYSVLESPAPCPAFPDTENPDTEIPDTENPDTENPDTEIPDTETPPQTNNNLTNNNQTKNNTTISSPAVPAETEAEMRAWYAEQLLLDALAEDCDAALLGAILSLLVEAETARAPLRVNGEALPADRVRARFRQLDEEHIRYVVDALAACGAGVRDPRAWLRTALYNAPEAMEAAVAALFLAHHPEARL